MSSNTEVTTESSKSTIKCISSVVTTHPSDVIHIATLFTDNKGQELEKTPRGLKSVTQRMSNMSDVQNDRFSVDPHSTDLTIGDQRWKAFRAEVGKAVSMWKAFEKRNTTNADQSEKRTSRLNEKKSNIQAYHAGLASALKKTRDQEKTECESCLNNDITSYRAQSDTCPPEIDSDQWKDAKTAWHNVKAKSRASELMYQTLMSRLGTGGKKEVDRRRGNMFSALEGIFKHQVDKDDNTEKVKTSLSNSEAEGTTPVKANIKDGGDTGLSASSELSMPPNSTATHLQACGMDKEARLLIADFNKALKAYSSIDSALSQFVKSDEIDTQNLGTHLELYDCGKSILTLVGRSKVLWKGREDIYKQTEEEHAIFEHKPSSSGKGLPVSIPTNLSEAILNWSKWQLGRTEVPEFKEFSEALSDLFGETRLGHPEMAVKVARIKEYATSMTNRLDGLAAQGEEVREQMETANVSQYDAASTTLDELVKHAQKHDSEVKLASKLGSDV